jgi:hypothetical protein
MIATLSALCASQILPDRTAIVFAGDLFNVQTPSGPRLVYGAYYPTSGPISLADGSSTLNATLTFPEYCTEIGISNEPEYDFLLPLASDIPDRPFVNICVWFHSTPANVSYSYHSTTNNTLQLEQVDGDFIPPRTLLPGDQFEFDHDVLLRWLIVSPEETSIFQPALRIVPAPGYPPEQTFSTFFPVGDDISYFDPPPGTGTPPQTDTPPLTDAMTPGAPTPAPPPPPSHGMSAGAVGGVVVGAVAIVVVGFVAVFCIRRYKGRKGDRPERVQVLPSDLQEPVPSSGLFVGYKRDGIAP